MAKIGEATPVGRQSLGGGRKVSVDRSGSLDAEGLATIGDAATGVAVQHIERENKFNYALAKSSFLTADIESRSALEEDPDWETWEERHEQALAKALDASTVTIRSKSDRAAFDMEAKIDMARSLGEVRKLARMREVDAGRADLNSSLEAMQRVALETTDVATRAHLVKTANDMIAGARDAELPMINAQEAETLQKQWTSQYSEGAVSLMPDDDQMRVLKNPKGTPAQFIDPTVRQKMFREAESRNKQQKVNAKALAATDKIMGRYPNAEQRKQALSEVSKIGDSSVQLATRAMVNGRFAELNQIESEVHGANLEYVQRSIEAGAPIESISSTKQWQDLSNSEQRAAELRYRQVVEGVEPPHDPAAYHEWNTLTQQEQLDADIWSKYKHRVDDQHFNAMESRQRALRDASEGDIAAQGVIRDGNTQVQMINDRLLRSGLFKKKPTKDRPLRDWVAMEDEINRQIIYEAEAKGDKLSSAEMSTIIDRELIRRAFTTVGMPDPERFTATMTERELEKAFTPLDEMPADDKIMLENFASSVGRVPSKRTLERAHAAWISGDFERAKSIIMTED